MLLVAAADTSLATAAAETPLAAADAGTDADTSDADTAAAADSAADASAAAAAAAAAQVARMHLDNFPVLKLAASGCPYRGVLAVSTLQVGVGMCGAVQAL